MKNTTIVTMAALLLGASGLYAVETTAYTKPSGFVTHTLKAGQFNLIGLTLHEAIIASGSFTTVAGTSLIDSNLDFDSILIAEGVYILEITEASDSALVGTMQEITEWSGNTITTPSDLDASGLVAGDKYQLRKAASLSSVFGADNSAGLPSGLSRAASATVWVQDPASSNGFTSYFYRKALGAVPAQWRKVNADGNGDVELADASTVSIIYTDAIYIQNPTASDVSVVFTGVVKTVPTLVALTETFNRIAVVYPVGTTLQNSGLQDTIASELSAAASDIVFVQQADGSYDRYFYRKALGAIPAGWKILDDENNATDAPADVDIKSGILIQQPGAHKEVKITPAYTGL